jgi:predicted phosphodiesterase
MARYGVLGDIHGNREALEAVLRALDERGVRQFLCVGDIVGYNADPDECPEPHVVLVHGGVRDVQLYMVTPALVAENARFLAEDHPGARVCFFGHSHEQRVFEVDGDAVREVKTDGQVLLRKENTYFINPGSVDASRKNRHKFAECALFDSAFGSLEFLRLRYDAAATEAKAAAFGYRINPLTERLYRLRRRTASAARRLAARRPAAADRGR